MISPLLDKIENVIFGARPLIVGLFLMSWFVGVTAASNLLLTVILATLAFVVLAQSGAMFRGQSTYARRVDAGHWIASLVIMIIANAVF